VGALEDQNTFFSYIVQQRGSGFKSGLEKVIHLKIIAVLFCYSLMPP
jgi:hypothetical protein